MKERAFGEVIATKAWRMISERRPRAEWHGLRIGKIDQIIEAYRTCAVTAQGFMEV